LIVFEWKMEDGWCFGGKKGVGVYWWRKRAPHLGGLTEYLGGGTEGWIRVFTAIES